MLIYTFRFLKTKQMRFSSLINDENRTSFRRKNWRKRTEATYKKLRAKMRYAFYFFDERQTHYKLIFEKSHKC